MKNRLLLIFALLFALALPVFAQEGDDAPVLTVNGGTVSRIAFGERTQFEFALTQQLAQFRFQALQQQAQAYGVDVALVAQQDQQFQRWLEELQDPSVLGIRILDTLTNELLLQQYAAENGLDVTEDEVLQAQYDFFGYDPETVTEEQTALYNEFVENFGNEMFAAGAPDGSLDAFFMQQAIATLIRAEVANQEEFMFADAAHILVETEEEANALLLLIRDGEDFGQLAIERSLDTGSGENGGALGDAPILYYVTPFANAIRDGEVGTIVGPIETQFGYHIIRIDSKEMRPVDDLEQKAQFQGLLFQQWVIEQTETADVVIADDWNDWVIVPSDEETAPETTEEAPAAQPESTEEADS